MVEYPQVLEPLVKSELKYHALSQHYQLLRLDTNENWNFSTLTSALERMGTLKDYMLPALPTEAHHNNASIVVYSRLAPKTTVTFKNSKIICRA